MLAVVLAVGIVVDDAIVVVEAVEHHIEHGLTPLQATEKAMDEVSGPVVAIGLVLCAVFVPVSFMGGIVGQLYRQFAITISDLGDPVGDRGSDPDAGAVQHDAAAAQGNPRPGRRVPARLQQGLQQDHQRISRAGSASSCERVAVGARLSRRPLVRRGQPAHEAAHRIRSQ